MSLLLTGDTALGSTRTLLTDQNGILQVAINSAGDTASSTQISNTSANPVPVALVGDALSSVTVSGTVTVSNPQTSVSITGTPTVSVQGGNATAVKVDGSAVTQPVSGTVSVSGTVPVSGTFYQATQPVSGTVTANVQGGNSTAVKVDGSAVTQPVSGAVTVSNTSSNPVPVALVGDTLSSVKVDGSAVTQPVSGTVTVSNPQTSVSITGTPTVNVQGGNSTAVKVDGSAVTQPVSGTVSVSGTVPVSGTFYQATQPVSGTVTANVQGGNSTAVKVDGSAVTQPVSGTVTVNAGTNLNTSALALESGGNLTTIATKETAIAAAAGTTADTAWTSGTGTLVALGKATVNAINASLPAGFNTIGSVNVLGGNTTAVKVDGSAVTQPVSGTVSVSGTVPVSGTFYQATQPVSGTVNVQGGNSTAVKVDGSAVTQPISGSVSTPPVSGSLTAYNGALIANTSSAIIAASTLTKYLFIQNTSSATMYLAFGTAATTSNGIQIPASGGSMVFESNFLTNQSINLLSVAGGTYVAWGA